MQRRTGKGAMARRQQPAALFSRCSQEHRVRLGSIDQRNAFQGEAYVQICVAPHVRVYRVRCPVCGDDYTVSDVRVERVPS